MSRKADRDKKQAGSVRLDKLLAQEGFGSRSDLGKAIRGGRACVNGTLVKDPGLRVCPQDEILFDGKAVTQQACVYYMLHKPSGVISATEDSRERTVLDLLRNPVDNPAAAVFTGVSEGNSAGRDAQAEKTVRQGSDQEGLHMQPVLRRGLFPVGRLDKDTEGLLLITDDGQLAHRLLAPGKHVEKTYYAIVSGLVTEEDVRMFAQGLKVDGEFTAMPARLCRDVTEDRKLAALLPDDHSALFPSEITQYSQIFVTITEGKYHQIKRMFAAIGKEVLYLKRLSMGSLYLDPALAPGQFRPLTREEIDMLVTRP